MNDLDQIKENFPFITAIKCHKDIYIGIVQNTDDKFVTLYDYSMLKSSDERQQFLNLGEIWWNESNRLLPISVFLPGQLTKFRYCLKTISLKESTILFGPTVSLANLTKKRIKRKQIQLIRKM